MQTGCTVIKLSKEELKKLSRAEAGLTFIRSFYDIWQVVLGSSAEELPALHFSFGNALLCGAATAFTIRLLGHEMRKPERNWSTITLLGGGTLVGAGLTLQATAIGLYTAYLRATEQGTPSVENMK